MEAILSAHLIQVLAGDGERGARAVAPQRDLLLAGQACARVAGQRAGVAACPLLLAGQPARQARCIGTILKNLLRDTTYAFVKRCASYTCLLTGMSWTGTPEGKAHAPVEAKWQAGQARTVMVWQGREQAWLPHGSGQPQGAAQENLAAELQGSWAVLWRP